jgi:hypothetical protein
MLFTPWDGSPEHAAARKIVDDAAARVKTVKDDTARISQKISTYKKETLEKLIKDAKAGYDASLKKNQENAKNGPEYVYLGALRAKEKQLIEEIRDEIKKLEAKIGQVTAEADQFAKGANTFRANGEGKGGGSMAIFARLCEAYEAQIEVLKKELAVAGGEKTHNPKRTV